MGKIRLAVFVSGSGRSLENLARLIAARELDCEIGLVLSDRPGVAALERARRAGIEHLVLDYRELGGSQAFSQRAFEELAARGCNRVVLAGFLRLLELPAGWEGRVMNIHPSLLPKYGGKGFYGERVHRAVLEAGARWSSYGVLGGGVLFLVVGIVSLVRTLAGSGGDELT